MYRIRYGWKVARRPALLAGMIKRLALALLFLAAPAAAQEAPVDPFIGTGGEGHTFPGAVAPFGMVQLSPDTDTGCAIRDCYDWAAGYRYDDPTILGFSHTHFSGAGHSDLGDVLVMPVAGEPCSSSRAIATKPGSGYRSRFSHDDRDRASPAITRSRWPTAASAPS